MEELKKEFDRKRSYFVQVLPKCPTNTVSAAGRTFDKQGSNVLLSGAEYVDVLRTRWLGIGLAAGPVKPVQKTPAKAGSTKDKK